MLIDEYEKQIPFLFLENIKNSSLECIKFFPKNVFQLENPEYYIINEINSIKSTPYRIAFFKRTDIDEFMKFVKNVKNLKIILLESEKDKSLKSKLKQINDFLTRIVDVSKVEFGNEIDLTLEKLVLEKNEIFKSLQIKNNVDDYLNVKLDISYLKHFEYFAPTKNNHLIFNNIIGNFSYKNDINKNLVKEESKKAIKESKTFIRLNLYLKQIESFNFLTKKYSKATYPLEYFFEQKPITFCLPFSNPDMLDFFKENKGKELKKRFLQYKLNRQPTI